MSNPLMGSAGATGKLPMYSARVAKKPGRDKPSNERTGVPEAKTTLSLPESPIVSLIMEQQRLFDDVLARKRIEARDMLSKVDYVHRRVRVTITNTHSNQQNPLDSLEPPSWVLSVHARLLDPAEVLQQHLAVQTGGAPLGLTGSGSNMMLGGQEGGGHGKGTSFKTLFRRVEVHMGVQAPQALVQPAQPSAAQPSGTPATGAESMQGAGAPGPMQADVARAQATHAHTQSAGKQGSTPLQGQGQGSGAGQGFTQGTGQGQGPGQEQGGGHGQGAAQGIQDPGHAADCSTPSGQGSAPVEVFVWDAAKNEGPPREGIEIRRVGKTGCPIKIMLWPDNQPERLLLPRVLAEVLGMGESGLMSRGRLGHALRLYAQKYNLLSTERRKPKQPKEETMGLKAEDGSAIKVEVKSEENAATTPEPEVVELPPKLAELFGATSLPLRKMVEVALAMLQPVPPITIYHTIQVTGPSPAPASVLDTEHESLAPYNPDKEASLKAIEDEYPAKEMERVDGDIAKCMRRYNELKRRRSVYMGAANDPIGFAMGMMAAMQGREARHFGNLPDSLGNYTRAQFVTNPQLETALLGSAAQTAEKYEVLRRTELFKGKWAEDAVLHHMLRKAGQRM